MSKKKSAGAVLASMRWAKSDADRDQPRQAGKLGGRKPTCACGTCSKCKRREKAKLRKEGSQ